MLLQGIPRELKEQKYLDQETGEVKTIQVMRVDYMESGEMVIDTETAEKYRHLMDKKLIIPFLKSKKNNLLMMVAPDQEPTIVRDGSNNVWEL